jgi:uncharacterized protein RhaS with RHS repeats
LFYFGKRYYDAEIGRWICIDPAKQFFDGYNYTGGNPINLTDPDGLFTPEQIAGALKTASEYRISQSTYQLSAKGPPGEPVDCSGVAANCYPSLPPIDKDAKSGTDFYYNYLEERKGAPQVGDLVFFTWSKDNPHAHMGIITSVEGEDIKYTHAREKSNAVVESEITQYYKDNFNPEYRYDPVREYGPAGENNPVDEALGTSKAPGPWATGYVFPE